MKNKIENLNFDKIWRNSYFSYYLLIRSDLLYKLLYYAIKANGYIYKCTRDKTNILPYCNYCKQTEYILHLFTNCTKIQKIWKYYQPYYKKLTKNQFTSYIIHTYITHHTSHI